MERQRQGREGKVSETKASPADRGGFKAGRQGHPDRSGKVKCHQCQCSSSIYLLSSPVTWTHSLSHRFQQPCLPGNAEDRFINRSEAFHKRICSKFSSFLTTLKTYRKYPKLKIKTLINYVFFSYSINQISNSATLDESQFHLLLILVSLSSVWMEYVYLLLLRLTHYGLYFWAGFLQPSHVIKKYERLSQIIDS